MPGGTIQLDPVMLGDDREAERREAARAALAQMMPSGSLEGIGEPNMPPPGSAPADDEGRPPLPPLSPEPRMSDRDEAQAAEATRIGDTYRASLRTPQTSTPAPAAPAAPAPATASPERPAMQFDPVPMNAAPEERSRVAEGLRAAPSQPMGPLVRPGESAAVMAQVAPQGPAPVDRARLAALLRNPPGRQGPTMADVERLRAADPSARPDGEFPVRPDRGPMLASGLADPRDSPEDRATRARFHQIVRDRQAQIDRGEVPRELHDEPGLPPPQPPRAVRPGGPAAQLDNPGDDAMPPGEFVDPAAPPPSERARLEQLLRARQAQRPLPSASPAGAPDPTAAPVRDFTGADWHDAIRRPLHAIGNALQAAGGRSATPFRSERAELEQRFAREDAQRTAAARGEREADSAARDADLDERRLTLAERTAASQEELGRERNEISREFQGRRADISEDRTGIAERALELRQSGMGEQEALARARREAIEGDTRRSEALRIADSPESRSERAEMMAELETARSELGFTPPPSVMEFLGTATGEQVQRYRETLTDQHILRPRTARRGGPGGGGGGAPGGVPRAQWGTEADPIYQDAIASGVPESTARALATNGAERTRLARNMASGAMTETRGAGRQTEADTRALGRDIDAGARVERATSHARQMIEGASDAELRAAFMGGELGSIMPERVQRLRSALNEMQASVLMERSGASVAEEEFERTRREMGTIPTQSTGVIRDWVARHDNNARDLRARIRARYGADVVSEYDSRLEREGIAPEAHPNAPRARGGAPAADTVTVTNGTRRISLSRAQYERRRQQIEADGYEVEE